MIDYSSEIGIEARWFGHAPIKPGHLPEIPGKKEEMHTHDPPEKISICMSSCPFDDECHNESSLCPLYEGKKRKYFRSGSFLDKKLLTLLSSGWVNREAICEELGISASTYYDAKRRLRERGEIN